jgi:hypothetical protein
MVDEPMFGFCDDDNKAAKDDNNLIRTISDQPIEDKSQNSNTKSLVESE